MGWRGYIDHDRKTVFFWSQKAACTTLFRVLADNMKTPPAKKKFFHTASVPYWHCRPLIEGQGYRSVIVVRHPTIRAISAFFNKFVIYRRQPLLGRGDLESFAQDLHDAFVARTGAPPEANTMSFEDYLDTVEELLAHRPAPGHPVNGHWDTQAPEALVRDRRFSYDHIVHVERFDAEMHDLGRRIGLNVASKPENATPLATGHDGYLGGVPAARVTEHAFGYENFLLPRTINQIARIYDVDFRAFGYDPDPRKPGGPLGPPGLADRMRAGASNLLGRSR